MCSLSSLPSSSSSSAPIPTYLKTAKDHYFSTSYQIDVANGELPILQSNIENLKKDFNDLQARIQHQRETLQLLENSGDQRTLDAIEQQTKSIKEAYLTNLTTDASKALENAQNLKNRLLPLEVAKKEILEKNEKRQKFQKILSALTLHSQTIEADIKRIKKQILDTHKKIGSLSSVRDLYKTLLEGESNPTPILTPLRSDVSSSSTEIDSATSKDFSSSTVSSSSTSMSLSSRKIREVITESEINPINHEDFSLETEKSSSPAPVRNLSASSSLSSSSSSSTTTASPKTDKSSTKEAHLKYLGSLITPDMPQDLKIITIYNNSPIEWTKDASTILGLERHYLNSRIKLLRAQSQSGNLKIPNVTVRDKTLHKQTSKVSHSNSSSSTVNSSSSASTVSQSTSGTSKANLLDTLLLAIQQST